ncbi:uncharacterized protein LOC134811262 [Bolinopsis microptera]|uniref:uncharacterized protein LOC134811262 n=1 Tax=Bolinopsis microptera TaxID=2820187 RepID=UPI00307A1EB2
MLFYLTFCLICVYDVRGTCSRDETVEAAKVAEQVDDKPINTDTWTEGETATIRCKDYAKSWTWTNSIRALPGVETSKIDEYDSVTNKQLGYIVVKCEGNSFKPDIFTGQTSWCALGCAPIPEDTTHYWKATYPDDTVTTVRSAAPVNVNPATYVTVSCRDGYARKNNDNGAKVSKCDVAGWIEPLSSFPKCVPGCPDLTMTVNNRVALNTKRSDTQAPFITGDTIEFKCQDSHKMVGDSTITCSSLNSWDRSAPLCVNTALRTTPLVVVVVVSLLGSLYVALC